MTTLSPIKLHFHDYIEQHKALLVPPVCNKMIHNDGKLRVMIVGGPNQRKDYHMNLGEELFYMVKGNMNLKIMEQGKPKDVVIKEGEIFMLPGGIPHSPQREENTVGLVIERTRPENELDGLVYYVDDSNEKTLWRRFFHVTDLGKQLGPLIKEYFASEEHNTRVPAKDMPPAAWEPDTVTKTVAPYPLASRFHEVENGGNVVLFNGESSPCGPGGAGNEFVVTLLGGGNKPTGVSLPIKNECWVWMLSGKAVVNETEELVDANTYIAFDCLHALEMDAGAKALLVYTTHIC